MQFGNVYLHPTFPKLPISVVVMSHPPMRFRWCWALHLLLWGRTVAWGRVTMAWLGAGCAEVLLGLSGNGGARTGAQVWAHQEKCWVSVGLGCVLSRWHVGLKEGFITASLLRVYSSLSLY